MYDVSFENEAPFGFKSLTKSTTVSCYSTPSIVPMFIDNRKFKFEFHTLPALPALLHATSGARAIALRHFTLVKVEVFDRTQPVPAPPTQPQQPLPLLQIAQALIPIPPQAPLLHAQNQVNGINAPTWQNAGVLSNSPSQGASQHGHPQGITNAHIVSQASLSWAAIAQSPPLHTPPYGSGMFAPFQPALPMQTSQAQGPSFPPLHPHSAQPFPLSQYHSQHLGAIQPQGTSQMGQQLPAPGWSTLSQSQQLQTSIQHGPQVHGLQHHGFHQSIFGGGFQPTTGQSSGHQSFTQHNSQYLGALTQSIFGGSFPQAPSQPVGHQTLTQHGPQQHGALHSNIFGGSFQSTSAPAQQNFTHTIPQPHGTNQTTGPRAFNPPVGTLANNSYTVALHSTSAIPRRLLPADTDSDDGNGRYFYVNHGSDFFRLQVGDPTSYHYPVFSIAQFPQLLNSVSDEDRRVYLQELQRTYTVPSPFPASSRLPGLFANIQHLVLNLELPPCHAPLRSSGFRSWMRRNIDKFCSITVKSTIAKFPKIKNLDLLIAGDIKRGENDRMVLRHWRYAPIREENGITFGHAELGLLEMEIRLWMMGEFMGKNGPEGPEVRIVVHVPQHYSQTKW
jgi:hypothetical protein